MTCDSSCRVLRMSVRDTFEAMNLKIHRDLICRVTHLHLNVLRHACRQQARFEVRQCLKIMMIKLPFFGG